MRPLGEGINLNKIVMKAYRQYGHLWPYCKDHGFLTNIASTIEGEPIWMCTINGCGTGCIYSTFSELEPNQIVLGMKVWYENLREVRIVREKFHPDNDTISIQFARKIAKEVHAIHDISKFFPIV